jgi:hypothetical protein
MYTAVVVLVGDRLVEVSYYIALSVDYRAAFQDEGRLVNSILIVRID